MRRRLTLAVVLLALARSAPASQPQLWRLETARGFLEGDTEGLSVDSEGRLRLAPASRVVHDPATPYVWCLARDEQGRIYAGTGNEGKVFRVEGQFGSVLFDAPELEVHALAVGPDGRLYAGSSPDGKVYAIDQDGKSEVFYDPADRYIWALAFDAQGRLWVATGAEGRVHRVDRSGKGEIVLTTAEGHIASLAVDGKGNVYAGSSPGGIIYRIDPTAKVFAIYDSPFREVKAIDVGPDGALYAALVDGKENRVIPPPALPPAPMTTVSAGEGAEVVFAPPATPPSPAAVMRAPEPVRSGPRGAVLRIAASGEIETLWSSPDELPHSLVATEAGVLVGTGNKGKLYRMRDAQAWTMVAAFPAEQVTALARDRDGAVLLATSNPGKLLRLEGGAGEHGTFTSKPKDSETVSAWGRLRWQVDLPAGTAVSIQTRSGNTATPDTTWSDWSAAYARKEGEPVNSERARFLQVRAALNGRSGASPVLSSVTVAYLQRNLRPQVQSITVLAPGEVLQKPIAATGEPEILGLDPADAAEARPGAPSQRPAAAFGFAFARKMYQRGIQTLTWKTEDANGDTMAYEVSYRLASESRFRTLRRGLTEEVLAWDTTAVPNGRYVVKVTALDAPGNPPGLALTGEKESEPFDVDNTPPQVTATLVERKPLTVRVVARDDWSPIRRAEYSVDAGRWQEVHPVDGINDSPEETYEIRLGDLAAPGPHVVVIRAVDLLGNVAAARVEIP